MKSLTIISSVYVKENDDMNKKIVVSGLIIGGLVLAGIAGKNFADDILLWGGEDNIEQINHNLESLDKALENKEQNISSLNSRLSSNNQELEQAKANVEEYKQKVLTLENDKNQLTIEKTNLENQLSGKMLNCKVNKMKSMLKLMK